MIMYPFSVAILLQTPIPSPTPTPLNASDVERVIREFGVQMTALVDRGTSGTIIAFMLLLVFIFALAVLVAWRVGWLKPRVPIAPAQTVAPLDVSRWLTAFEMFGGSLQSVVDNNARQTEKADEERAALQEKLDKRDKAFEELAKQSNDERKELRLLLDKFFQARQDTDKTLMDKVEDVLRLVKESEGLGAAVDIIKKTSNSILDTASGLTLKAGDVELLIRTSQSALEKIAIMQRELSIVTSQLTQKKRETTDKLAVIKPDDSRPLPPLTPQQEAT